MTARRPGPLRGQKFDRLLSPKSSGNEIRCDYAAAPFDRMDQDMDREEISPVRRFVDSQIVGDLIGLKRAERCLQHRTALTNTRPLGGPTMADSQHICSIGECGNPAYLRTFCNAHYLRWRRHGSPTGGGIQKGEPLRWLKVAIQTASDTCIEWPFASNGNGYGWAYYQGSRIGAHRLALVLASGSNPTGCVAAHACHNRACVNPQHLSWKTQTANLLQTTRGPGTKSMKLNEAKVRDIRQSDQNGGVMARKYGVSISTISKIRTGVNWNA